MLFHLILNIVKSVNTKFKLKTLNSNVRVFGAERCHKTQFYLDQLQKKNIHFEFLDVEKDMTAANELRSLYTTGKLNFPTIMVKDKKLRNPSLTELEKWLIKKELY